METDPIAAIRSALALLDAGADNPAAWQSAMAMLPVGGVACEDRVKAAVEVLRAAALNHVEPHIPHVTMGMSENGVG